MDYSWLFSDGGLIILGFDSFINTPCLHMFCNAHNRQSIPPLPRRKLSVLEDLCNQEVTFTSCVFKLLYEWSLRLLLRTGSIDSSSVTAAEVDNKCVIEKDPLGVTGRSATRETQSRIEVGSVRLS